MKLEMLMKVLKSFEKGSWCPQILEITLAPCFVYLLDFKSHILFVCPYFPGAHMKCQVWFFLNAAEIKLCLHWIQLEVAKGLSLLYCTFIWIPGHYFPQASVCVCVCVWKNLKLLLRSIKCSRSMTAIQMRQRHIQQDSSEHKEGSFSCIRQSVWRASPKHRWWALQCHRTCTLAVIISPEVTRAKVSALSSLHGFELQWTSLKLWRWIPLSLSKNLLSGCRFKPKPDPKFNKNNRKPLIKKQNLKFKQMIRLQCNKHSLITVHKHISLM